MVKSKPEWYALYTKPRAERQVSELLAARGIETYMPLLTVWRTRRRRVESEALFPCYCFAHFDLTGTGAPDLKWTPGLKSIVSFGDRPVPIPENVVAYVRRRVVELNTGTHAPLQIGARVRVTEGPLKDLEGVLNGHIAGRERARVLIELLGRLVQCEVADAWLESA